MSAAKGQEPQRLEGYSGSESAELKYERNRILYLIEEGQLTAMEAAQLLDTLEEKPEIPRERKGYTQNRVVRIRATNRKGSKQKINMTASLPVSLLRTSLRLGGQLIPQLNSSAVQDLLRSIDSGHTGRLLDLQDLEQGERLEIFVE